MPYVFSTLWTTSIPSITLPKTTCLLFKKGVGTLNMSSGGYGNCGAWHRKTYSGNEELAAVGVFAGVLVKHEPAKSFEEILTSGVLTAMLSKPGVSCFSWKFSSAKALVPYMHVLPVPSPLRKSPPCIMNSLICDESDAIVIRNHTNEKDGPGDMRKADSNIQRGETCCLCNPEADLGDFYSRLCNIDGNFQPSLEWRRRRAPSWLDPVAPLLL